MNNVLDIYNLEVLRERLVANAALPALQNIVRASGERLQSLAKGFAPVDTGFLRDNISLTLDSGGFKAVISSQAPYAVFQEFGTRHMPGTAHIGPAFYSQKQTFLEDIRHLFA